ncbi:hypothetical protein SRHO_G00272700 [Serrasalmus rhombeus]
MYSKLKLFLEMHILQNLVLAYGGVTVVIETKKKYDADVRTARRFSQSVWRVKPRAAQRSPDCIYGAED